jgi:pimeloyl-ACP methyl ester carboxylesterase
MNETTWVDQHAYPFRSRYLDVGPGRLHYVDEGEGSTILVVHGTPTWSFLFRHLVRDLSRDHRVVAVDHLGFGLSDKPEDWGYRPEDHARNLGRLVEELGLERVTLVAHDFGGPIGLGWALQAGAGLRGLVLFNTWMWSLRGTQAERMSRVLGGAVGRFLYTRLNFSPRVLIRAAFGDRRKLTREVHRHYMEAFPTPADRHAPWVLARELAGSSDWYERLWNQRERLVTTPVLLLWGMKDPAFGPAALRRWQEALPHAQTVEFPEAGHFVQEEAPDQATSATRTFLTSLP